MVLLLFAGIDLFGDELVLSCLYSFLVLIRTNPLALHVSNILSRNLCKSLPSKVNLGQRGPFLAAVVLEIDEIDHISNHRLPCLSRVKRLVILIQFFELAEVTIPKTNQHDGKRKV